MADNLSVSITADTASLRAQLAQAAADVRAFGAETRRLANDLRSAGADAKGGLSAELEKAAGQLGRAESAAAGFRKELRAGTAAHHEHAAGIHAINEAVAGLTSPLTGAVGGLKELAELTGVAFAVEKLGEFIKETAEAAEKTENTAAALGIGAARFSQLSVAMRLAGGDAELAARSLTILQTKLVEAVENPASKAREAFLAMGISLAEMKAGLNDVPGFLDRVADGFVRMGDGAARTAAFRDVFGRGMREMVPYLKDGAEHIQKLNAAAEKTGAALTDTQIQRFATLAEEIHTLELSFTGLGVAITDGLVEPLGQGIEQLTELVQHLTAARSLGEVIRLIDPGDVEVVEKLAAGWERFKRIWDDVQEATGHGRPSGTLPEGAAAAPLPPKPLPPTTQPGAGFGTREGREGIGPSLAENAPPVDPAVEQKNLNLEVKKVTDALKEKEAELDLAIVRAKGNQARIEELEQQKIAAARKAAKDEEAIREKYARGAEERGNTDLAGQYRTGGGSLKVKEIELDKQALEEQQRYAEQVAAATISGLEQQRRIKDQIEAADLASVQRRVQLGQVTVEAAAAAEAQIVEAHKAAVLQILAQEEDAAQGQIKLAQEVQNRKAELEQQTTDKIRAIKEKAQDEELRRAKATDAEIASGLSSAIMGALQGKESLGQGIQKIFEEQEKKLLDKALNQVLDASGIGKALGEGEDSLLGLLPGAPKTAAKPEDALRSATADNTAATRDNTAALRQGQAPAKAGAPAAGTGSGAAAAPAADINAPAGGAYAGSINAAAAQYDVPPQILANLIGAESGFRPNAEGPPIAKLGGVTAKGLGQFIPVTAAKYGVDVASPDSSIFGAAHYLSDLHGEKGSWAGALGAYSGQGPSLSGYAAQKNAYGPALVSAARAADSGAKPAAVASGAPAPVDVQAVAGTSVSSSDGLPVAPQEPPVPGQGQASAVPEYYLGSITGDQPPAHDAAYFARRYANRGDLAGGAEPIIGPEALQNYVAPPLGAPTEHPAPVLGGSPFSAAGVAGAPGTPAGPGLPQPTAAPDLGNGFPGVADKSLPLAGTGVEDLKGSIDKLTASTDKAAAAKSAAPAPSGGDQGNGRGSLLGLLALGGVAAAAFGRRTTGSAASSSPGTVFSSGGITTQTTGSVHPALAQTNPKPSEGLAIAGAAIAGIGVLGALSKLFAGGNNTNSAGPDAFLLPGTDQPLAGGSSAGNVAGTTTQGTVGSITGLASAIGTLDPAAKTATSAFSSLVSGLSGLFGGGGGGGGGGGSGAIGGLFSLITAPLKLFSLFAEAGAVVPSAKDGLVLGRVPSAQGGLKVDDGKGGTMAIVHPNETILPSPFSQLVQDLAEDHRIGKITAALPQLGAGAIGLPPSPHGFAPPALPPSPDRGDFGAAAAGDTHYHYEGDTHKIDITAFDGHDVERLFMRNGQALARSLARQKRITNSSWSH